MLYALSFQVSKSLCSHGMIDVNNSSQLDIFISIWLEAKCGNMTFLSSHLVELVLLSSSFGPFSRQITLIL